MKTPTNSHTPVLEAAPVPNSGVDAVRTSDAPLNALMGGRSPSNAVRVRAARAAGTLLAATIIAALFLTAVAGPASASVRYAAVGNGLALRAGPGTQYAVIRTVSNGTPLDVACQVQGGTNVGGNATWDKLIGGEWVSDYYTTSPSFNSYAPGLGDCNPAPPSVQLKTKTSPNGLYSLIMQSDGNLVLYAQGSGARWSSATYSPGATALMQGDGNLVIHNASGAAIWSSGTYGHPYARLDVQDDGNVVIYSSSGSALWASRTVATYPYLYQAPALCNHVFRIDSATKAWDPLMQVEVSRSATFGYWNGHCVYKQSDTVGTDINTRELIVLTPYHEIGWHWDVLAAAGVSAERCNPHGLEWEGVLPVARLAFTSWCAAAGAAAYVYSG